MQIPVLKESFEPIQDIIGQGVTANILQGAVQLKVFDQMADESKTPAQVAKALGARERETRVLMDVLMTMGLLNKTDDRYANTPVASEYLDTRSPAFQGGYLDLTLDFYNMAFSDVPRLLTEGPSNKDDNKDMWSSPETLRKMGQSSMHGSLQDYQEFVRGLPGFKGFRRMCDLAGNHGFYTMALLDENPDMTGLLVDLPKVVEESGKLCRQMGYADRMDFKALDLQGDEEIGEDFDLLFASHILYGFQDNWDTILPKIAAAVKPGGFFVSNHAWHNSGAKQTVTSSVMELCTRLCGYSTHHIGRKELTEALAPYGFEESSTVRSEATRCMLYAARKK